MKYHLKRTEKKIAHTHTHTRAHGQIVVEQTKITQSTHNMARTENDSGVSLPPSKDTYIVSPDCDLCDTGTKTRKRKIVSLAFSYCHRSLLIKCIKFIANIFHWNEWQRHHCKPSVKHDKLMMYPKEEEKEEEKNWKKNKNTKERKITSLIYVNKARNQHQQQHHSKAKQSDIHRALQERSLNRNSR